MKATSLELEFIKKEKLANNIYSFYFNRKGLDFDFNPGQYIKIYLDIKKTDERGSSRYFTISSSPTDKDFLTITTKIVKSSFKLSLNGLRLGEIISAFGPLGYFDFDIKNKRNKVFLSGGMGITPYHSVLRYLSARNLRITITVISSFPTFDQAIFYNELKSFEKSNKALRITYSLTKDQKKYPGFERRKIDEKMIRKYVQNYKQADFFVVGPQSFEVSMFELLKRIGISSKKIFSENFPGY